MTGKVIDSGANGLLLVLLPFALVTMVVFVAWPLIVGAFALALGWKLWQTYQWQQLSAQIDPLFNQLVNVNQGCLTILDLSTKTGLSARISKWYLDRKKEEYGAVKRLYDGQGVVYYFLSANTLGSILDESEAESAPKTNLIPSSDAYSSQKDSSNVTQTPAPSTGVVDTAVVQDNSSTVQESVHDTNDDNMSENDNPPSVAPPEEIKSDLGEVIKTSTMVLNQTELAKRLEVSPSTVGKRKLDDDFGIWSQSRDPDGIPWIYKEEEKEFIPRES
ncbi:hypothetical protein IQ215_01450 [Cyanobacterium stanieri LEGE 03274]|uniref:Uncharacterized protein n=1 Tax=Cyanobacterium stanieri LEGE 03274 TaxID=1828756 RepID=A0ABR9V0E0_9CHRO|nr:hypothetical protein [Cyanobacterium stanieri]MBE9221351.1 hypothetical protein [Cyanobacterium stanieri LEGE 03274]